MQEPEVMIVELRVKRASERRLWAALLAILSEAKGEKLKDSADQIPAFDYSRALRIRAGSEMSHPEAEAVKIYFKDEIVYLEFKGQIPRIEVDRREED